MLRRAAAFLIVCVAIAALLYGAAVAWATFTSHPFTIGGLPPLPFPSIQPPGGGPGSGSPPPLPGQGPPGAPTPVAATQQPQPPGPQPSSKSCPALLLSSITLSQSQPRIEVVSWTTSGGCAPFGGSVSWSGQGVQSGSALIAGPSGSQTEHVTAPTCPPPPGTRVTATVTFTVTLVDGGGHRVQQSKQVQFQVC